MLVPGQWASGKISDFWERYIYLMGVREENEALKERLDSMSLELARYKEEASEVKRLRAMLSLPAPQPWDVAGARVVARRMGPHAPLDTILVDQGFEAGFGENSPVVTHQGVVGRVLRTGPHSATVLLIKDRNSSLAVISQASRITGMLKGQGVDKPLQLMYVPHNVPIRRGEVLVTSGLGGIFPKGMPVARITSVESVGTSLFQTIEAESLVDAQRLEEVMLLKRSPAATTPGEANATDANATEANATAGGQG